jgi:hypothetical protein
MINAFIKTSEELQKIVVRVNKYKEIPNIRFCSMLCYLEQLYLVSNEAVISIAILCVIKFLLNMILDKNEAQ